MSAPRSVPTTSTPSRPGRSSIVTSASIPMSSRSSLSTGTAAASSSERTGAASSRSSSRSSRCSRSASGRRGTSASSTVGCGSGSRSSSWNERSTRASSPPIPSMFAGFPFSRTSMSTSVRLRPSTLRPRSTASSTVRPVNSSPRSGLIVSASSLYAVPLRPRALTAPRPPPCPPPPPRSPRAPAAASHDPPAWGSAPGTVASAVAVPIP